MLTKLHIRNFKSWQDTQRIDLAPFTVFFGTNSSGKSSLNQFLLMLKQTAQSPDRKRVLHMGDKSTPIDLGTFNDITFKHKEENHIEFWLEWKIDRMLEIRDIVSDKRYKGDRIQFHAEIGKLPEGKRQELIVYEIDYLLKENENIVVDFSLKRKAGSTLRIKDEYELRSKNYTLARNPGRMWPLPPPTRFYGFPEEAIAYYKNTGALSDLSLALESFLQKLYYLGPLRQYPQRQYTWSGEVPEHVGWRGERAVDAILSAKGRKYNFKPRTKTKAFEELVAYWLKEMNLIQSFEVRQIAEVRREYEVLVRSFLPDEPVNVTDVGFGISQVLPVIVECFYCQPNSTLIIEQPEIHLHPSVQSSLADLLIGAINSRENEFDRHIQLIIESHSEHFLRRLQRRIAEGIIDTKQVAIYFCQPSEAGSTLQKLNVDLFGNITNWPKHFFGDDVEDLIAMTTAQANRMKATK